VFRPADETARQNIKSAFRHMAYNKPVFLPTHSLHYQYQVNPDDHDKIKEIWLEGFKISDLHVIFQAPQVTRWDLYSSNGAQRIEPVLNEGDDSAPGNWKFSLGVDSFSGTFKYLSRGFVIKDYDQSPCFWEHEENGSYVIKLYGTDSLCGVDTLTSRDNSSYVSPQEDENWFYTYVTFANPLLAEIKTLNSADKARETKYLPGTILPGNTIQNLLDDGKLVEVKGKNPFLNL
jgi:hypothetical protein